MTDRELDAAVARALGCSPMARESDDGDTYYVCTCPDNSHGVGGICENQLRAYSALIGRAWELLSEIGDGTEVTLNSTNPDCIDKSGRIWGWKVYALDQQGYTYLAAEEDTAPRAICLAFLKSKGAL